MLANESDITTSREGRSSSIVGLTIISLRWSVIHPNVLATP